MKQIETPYQYHARTSSLLLGDKTMGDRLMRMQYDFWEPALRFKKEEIRNTIVFFGSASILPPHLAEKRLQEVNAKIQSDEWSPEKSALQLKRAQRLVELAQYYTVADQLAYRLTEWSLRKPNDDRFYICTGGGNGIMEAANRGAYRAGGHSIGLSINIPTEQTTNSYVTPHLVFNFNYFLLRKFWFLYHARALIVFPGGVGTLDELFEAITLVMTGRQRKTIPIILYGSEFWKSLINFDLMIESGIANEKIYDAITFCDDIDSAYSLITSYLTEELKH